MLENSFVISLDFLLYLESVDVLGEAINISRRDSVNEASLANTITANETIFAALDQLEVSVFNQVVSSNDNVDG
jgi:hypothetical protein